MRQPTTAEVIREAIETRLRSLFTVEVGRVEIFDPATVTATVQPMVLRAVPVPDAEPALEQLPPIPNVPVYFLFGGGFSVTLAPQPGDFVLLLFASQAWQQWRSSGDLSPPGDLRRQSLANPIALPGFGPLLGQPPVDPTALLLEGPLIKAGASATMFVALADYVDARLATIQNAHDTHKHTETGGTTTAPDVLIGALETVAATKLQSE